MSMEGFGQKKKQAEIRRLSECEYKEGLAFCPHCEEFFIDDLPSKDVPCPNDKCGRPLQRNFTLKGNVVFDQQGRKFRTL